MRAQKRISIVLHSGHEVNWDNIVGEVLQLEDQLLFETKDGTLITVDSKAVAVFEISVDEKTT